MGASNRSTPPAQEFHEIRVQGHLDERWADGVAGLTFTHESDGTTTITGPLADQSALHGLLNRIRDLNVPIVSVRRVGAGPSQSVTMQAIVQDRYGSADVFQLQEVERPVVDDHELLVRVRAAGVDRGVWHLMTGLPYLIRFVGYGLRKPRRRNPGMDFAGRVEAVGKSVTRFGVGDEVFGTGESAFAEYVSVAEGTVAPKPAHITFEQAASVGNSAVAALQGLRDFGQVQTGHHVLVIGASGGVGTFAVQIAKVLGAEVTGVCSAAKADLVRSIGADHVIDYTADDLAAHRHRYDVILDAGGNRPLSHLRYALTPKGTLVIVGGEGGGRWIGGTDRPLRAVILSPFVAQTLRFLVSEPREEDLQFLSDLMDAGQVTPVVDRTYPLREVRAAIRYLEAGHARGKVVITM